MLKSLVIRTNQGHRQSDREKSAHSAEVTNIPRSIATRAARGVSPVSGGLATLGFLCNAASPGPLVLVEVVATRNVRRILLPHNIPIAVPSSRSIQQYCVGIGFPRPNEASRYNRMAES